MSAEELAVEENDDDEVDQQKNGPSMTAEEAIAKFRTELLQLIPIEELKTANPKAII
jgi:hypothetical protein